MTVTVTTAAEIPAEVLTNIKSALRITNDASNTLLSEVYIPSAIAHFEKFTNRAIFNQTIEQTFDCFPVEEYFLLERGTPLVNFTSIVYRNTENTTTTLSTDIYQSNGDSLPCAVHLKKGQSWPTDVHENFRGAVKVTYEAGYGTELSDVIEKEPMILHCLALMCSDLFNFREDQLYTPGGVLSSLDEIKFPTSRRIMRTLTTGYYEWRSQTRRT